MVQVINNQSEEPNAAGGKPLRRKSSDKGAHSSLKQIDINNLKDALDLLRKAIQENNQSIGKQCIEYLDCAIGNKINLLSVLLETSKILQPENVNNYRPSAPPLDPPKIEYWIQDLIMKLRHNILLEIDKHADYVLRQKEIVDLCYVDLDAITGRDTLQVSNEMLVYIAAIKWAEKECHRKNLSPESDLKKVLDGMRYAPRYGLMPKKDFLNRQIQGIKGPDRMGLLTETEIENILAYISNKTTAHLPNKGSQKRTTGNEKPHRLSDRTKNSSRDSSPRSECPKTKPSEKVLINFLSCWTAVFD